MVRSGLVRLLVFFIFFSMYSFLEALLIVVALSYMVDLFLERHFGLEIVSTNDLVFLEDEPTAKNNILGVLIMEKISFAELKELLLQRVILFHKRMRQVHVNHLGIDFWREVPLSVAERCIIRVTEYTGKSEEDMQQYVNALFNKEIDRSLPLFEMHVIENCTPKGETALVCLAHHGAIDGLGGTSAIISCADNYSRNLFPKFAQIPCCY